MKNYMAKRSIKQVLEKIPDYYSISKNDMVDILDGYRDRILEACDKKDLNEVIRIAGK
jgi:hypothetical protein